MNMNSLMMWGRKNLPGIFTWLGIFTGGATIIYSVHAGIKIKEMSLEIPPDADGWTKVKKYTPVVAPIIVGAVVSGACVYGAHREHSRRYLALAGTLALTQRNNEHLKLVAEKAQEKLGDKKAEEVKEEVKKEEIKQASQQLNILPTQRTWWHDVVTGMVFEATLQEFMDAVYQFNKLISQAKASTDKDSCYVSIDEFYQILLGDRYQYARTHEDVIFGRYTVDYFNPDYHECESAADMTMMRKVIYEPGSMLDIEHNTDVMYPYSDMGRIG